MVKVTKAHNCKFYELDEFNAAVGLDIIEMNKIIHFDDGAKSSGVISMSSIIDQFIEDRSVLVEHRIIKYVGCKQFIVTIPRYFYNQDRLASDRIYKDILYDLQINAAHFSMLHYFGFNNNSESIDHVFIWSQRFNRGYLLKFMDRNDHINNISAFYTLKYIIKREKDYTGFISSNFKRVNFTKKDIDNLFKYYDFCGNDDDKEICKTKLAIKFYNSKIYLAKGRTTMSGPYDIFIGTLINGYMEVYKFERNNVSRKE